MLFANLASQHFQRFGVDFETEKFNRGQRVLLSKELDQLRVFIARWFNYTIEEFEQFDNPRNCEMLTLVKQKDNKYKLEKPLKQNYKPKHPYQFPILVGQQT